MSGDKEATVKAKDFSDYAVTVGTLEVQGELVGAGVNKIITDASTAQYTASTVSADYNQLITDIAADSSVSMVEKPALKSRWDEIVVEYPLVKSNAVTAGISATGTEYLAYVAAYEALDTYLNTTLAIFADMAVSTTINASTFATKFSDYYTGRSNLTGVATVSAVPTYAPQYIGAFLFSTLPEIANKYDTATAYSATAKECGIYYYDELGTPVWNKINAPSSQQISASWPDICKAVKSEDAGGFAGGPYPTIAAWVTLTEYAGDDAVINSGNYYTCITAGTSGATGPVGTGTNEEDGTAYWNYVNSLNSFYSMAGINYSEVLGADVFFGNKILANDIELPATGKIRSGYSSDGFPVEAGKGFFIGDNGIKIGMGQFGGILETPVLETTDPQTGDTVSAPAGSRWMGTDFITNFTGLADGSTNATGTIDSIRTVDYLLKGDSNSYIYQSDDAVETLAVGSSPPLGRTFWNEVKTMVSKVRGYAKIYVDISNQFGFGTTGIMIYQNGVLKYEANGLNSIFYVTHSVGLTLTPDDSVSIYVDAERLTTYTKQFRICPVINTIGIVFTDDTVEAIKTGGAYALSGNVAVTGYDEFVTADNDTYWYGLTFINYFDALVRPYVEQLVLGGTFISGTKTPASIYINGNTSLRITFDDASTLTIYASTYYNYPATDHIDLLDDPGEIEMFTNFSFNPENYGSDLLFKLYHLTTLLFQVYPEGRMYLTAGRKPSGTIHTATATEEQLFELMKGHIPATNDTLCVHGYCNGYVVSRAIRTSSTEISFSGYRVSDGAISTFTITDGDTSPTFATSMTW